jgi:hypothetical protein
MKRPLLWLLAALLLLAAVYRGMDYRDKSRAAPRFAFGAAKAGEVVSLRVGYLGDSVTLVRSGGHWLTAGDSFPADTARLRRVLGHLLTLQDREKVSESADETRLTEYGLDSASARAVAWTLADGRVTRVLLGRISGIDYGSTFWKPAEEPVAYRTPGKFVFEVSSRAKDWKDTNLFVPFTTRDIRSVTVEWTAPDGVSHRYALERDSGGGDTGFALTEPFAAVASREAAGKIFRHAAQFKVDEFAAGFDPSAARAGLDKPVMTVRIVLKNGVENVVVAGNPVDGLYRYVRHPRHKDPVRVFLWRFEYFGKTAEGFLE